MKRRSFVKTSLLGATVSGMVPISMAAATEPVKNSKQVFFELRVYTFRNAEQQKLTEDYFEKAAICGFHMVWSKGWPCMSTSGVPCPVIS